MPPLLSPPPTIIQFKLSGLTLIQSVSFLNKIKKKINSTSAAIPGEAAVAGLKQEQQCWGQWQGCSHGTMIPSLWCGTEERGAGRVEILLYTECTVHSCEALQRYLLMHLQWPQLPFIGREPCESWCLQLFICWEGNNSVVIATTCQQCSSS